MKKTYLMGRPPWYDASGSVTQPLIVGVAGASAAGKTSVCKYPSSQEKFLKFKSIVILSRKH
jgi:uridine kinase